MQHDDKTEMGKVALDFGVASLHPNTALTELVRHLARISAENDYKAFLKSLPNRYSGPQQKGPPL